MTSLFFRDVGALKFLNNENAIFIFASKCNNNALSVTIF